MKTNNQTFGKLGEQQACKYLKDLGYQVLQRNYFSQYGEIDIIALLNDTLIFIEVKSRKNKNFEICFNSVSARKQRKILKTASSFLYKNPEYEDFFTQFDVIGVLFYNEKWHISHMKNAFNT